MPDVPNQMTIFDLIGKTIVLSGGAEYLHKSNLTLRGWTKSLISKFLGLADTSIPNPRYRYAAEQQLFRFDRVKRIEGTQEFQAELARTDQRRVSRKAAVATSRVRTDEQAAQLKIEVRLLEQAALIQRACDSYNSRKKGYLTALDFGPASPDSDRWFLERICVNYLRHDCTNYHSGLNSVSGRVGVQQAALKMKRRIIAAIAEKYPYLRTECMRQCPTLMAAESQHSGMEELAPSDRQSSSR